MSDYASIQSIDCLRDLRSAVAKFIDSVGSALLAADAEVDRTTDWLRRDRPAHWKGQLRKREEAVTQARLALNRKRSMPTATGAKRSTVDEEKELSRRRRLLEEAEHKALAVKRWNQQFAKAVMQYRSGVREILALVDTDLPSAMAELHRHLIALERYVALKPPSADRPNTITQWTRSDEPPIQQRPSESGEEGS